MFSNIPSDLKAYPNFVVWRFDQRANGTTTKIPFQPNTGIAASVIDPTHWSSFEDAIAVAHNYDGIGFVFSANDPFTGIDLDDTHGDEVAFEHQKAIFEQFDSYSEISPSGNGLHIIVRGSIPSGRRDGFIEMYSSGRYFTMTGNVYNAKPIADRQDELNALWAQLSEGKRAMLPFLPSAVHSDEPDQSIISRAFNAENGTKFHALWSGDGSVLNGDDKSGSAIDQALVNIIQFYTKNATQIERIWLSSPQGQRDKTQARKDYRDGTIARAFDRELPKIVFDGIENVVFKANQITTTTLEAPRPLRRELPPPIAFPIEQLGSILGEATKAIIDKVQCAGAIAAMSVLGAASLAVQAHADVVIPPTAHAKPLSLFLVTVAASGERKSAADFEALWPIRQFEKELNDHYNAAMPAYRNKLDAWEAEREKIKRNKQGDVAWKTMEFDALGVQPIPPLTPMLTCPEPTFEGLCKLYVNGMPMLGIFSDEGGQFVGGHGLSPDNRLRTITGLSGLWDGSPIKRVRVADGVSVLPGRRLAVHLMMQPDVASVLLSDPVLKDQGFLSRFLVASPVGIAGTRFQRRTQYSGSNALVRYNACLLELLRLTPPLAMGKQNELEPRKLPLGNSAIEMWMDYADAVESRLVKDGEFAPIHGFANKLPEHAARIAGVLTLIEEPSALAINSETFGRATIIAEYFASQSLRLFDAGLASPGIRLAETLLAWLHNKWREPFVGLKVIYQSGPNLIRDADAARKAVAILEEHGWLQRAPKGTQVADALVKEAWFVVRAPDAGRAATPATPATPATLLLTDSRVAG